jgi:hypothetical protein
MEEDRKEGSVVFKDDDEEDKLALQFMDSFHNYLSLTHSLSSTLRQVLLLSFNSIFSFIVYYFA